jgi:hypothetical protein
MDYLKVYRAIVERGQVRKPIDGEYYERHHIIPRCMGGGDEKDNLTTLTAREHFIAHWLLARIYPNHSGISYSFWGMCNQKGYNGKREYKVSSRAYQEAREISSANGSIKQSEVWSDEERRKLKSEQMKEYLSREDVKLMRSEKMKKYWEGIPSENRKRPPEVVEKIANSNRGKKGRIPWNKGTGKEKIPGRGSGWSKGIKKGPMSDEQKEKLRKSVTGFRHSEESKKKMSEQRKGLMPANHFSKKMSSNEINNVLKDYDDGLSLNKISKKNKISRTRLSNILKEFRIL